jgi:hypothetical protein
MKLLRPLLFLSVFSLVPAWSQDRVNVSEDDAAHSAYGGGWETGKNGGTGFGSWTLQSRGGVEQDSHSGFFVASVDGQGDIDGVGIAGRALGLFANGRSFEGAVAYRSLDAPLAFGDSFSLMMECSDFVRKFETDDSRPGSIGFSLRTGASSESCDDYLLGSRLQFGFYEGEANYQVHDGEDNPDTGVPVTDKGVAVTVTLVTPDTYDLEITALDTKETKKLAGRKLGGDAGMPIESFAIFNNDGETGDAYFNGFQVSRPASSIPR